MTHSVSKKVLILLLSSFFVSLFASSFKKRNEKIDQSHSIAASNNALGYLLKAIGGSEFNVSVIGGHDGHHGSGILPSSLRKLQSSAFLFSVSELDDKRINAIRNKFKNIQIVNLNKNLDLSKEEEKNFHFWLSRDSTIQVAGSVLVEMKKIYPDKSNLFDINFKKLTADIRSIDINFCQNFPVMSIHNLGKKSLDKGINYIGHISAYGHDLTKKSIEKINSASSSYGKSCLIFDENEESSLAANLSAKIKTINLVGIDVDGAKISIDGHGVSLIEFIQDTNLAISSCTCEKKPS